MGTPEQVSKRLNSQPTTNERQQKMAKSLSVKIPTQLLIEEIEKKLLTRPQSSTGMQVMFSSSVNKSLLSDA